MTRRWKDAIGATLVLIFVVVRRARRATGRGGLSPLTEPAPDNRRGRSPLTEPAPEIVEPPPPTGRRGLSPLTEPAPEIVEPPPPTGRRELSPPTEPAPDSVEQTSKRAAGGRRWKQGISCVTLIVIFVAVGLAQSATGRRVLRDLGLWASPEPFTALSFTHPLQLGKVGQYGPARVPVAFTIANRRQRATSYRWQIRVGSSVRVTGTVTIPASSSANVERRVLVPCRLPPYDRKTRRVKRIPPSLKQVTVLLTGHTQSIDFWEQCVG